MSNCQLCLIIMGWWCVSAQLVQQEIRMPGFRPPTEDYYVCTSMPVTEERYIVQYEAIAKASTAHHILLFACDQPYQPTETWQCGGTCDHGGSIMFAWAKNAPPTKLPEDVGFHIGGSSGVNHIVMQVHYLRAISQSEPADRSGIVLTTTQRVPMFSQGILLFVAGAGRIPPHQPSVHLDVSCHFKGDKVIHPFAYRTHAHTLSTVISAYKKSSTDSEWQLLGKGNPQWPQSFYPMNESRSIAPNDLLVARCVYNSTKSDVVTRIGATHKDEMCNFYMMYYVQGEAKYKECFGNNFPRQAKSIPADSLIRLPPNPVLDAMAHGHHHLDEKAPAENLTATFHVKVDGKDVPYMVEADGWYSPPQDITVGQVGGVDTDSKGNVLVFHRGSHRWQINSFDTNNIFLQESNGPVREKTVLQFDDSGDLTGSWGDNMFYLPHGITVDKDDNVWLTDVALHQVFMYTASNKSSPALVLGQRFKPGIDDLSFCKPADVAVRSDGGFYVADGYCNGRIVEFGKSGNVVRKWGSPGEGGANKFFVVHSLALSEANKQICAADREHKRIQCFDLDGRFRFLHKCPMRPFAIAYRADTDKMVVAMGDQKRHTGMLSMLHVSASNAQKMGDFHPTSKVFNVLHDLAIAKDGQAAYVGQLDPPYIYKFAISVHDSADSTIDASLEKDSILTKPIDSVDGGVVSQTVPIIVAVLLVVPVVCVLIALIAYKICQARKGTNIHGTFDMGNMFNRRQHGDMQGFTPLASKEDYYSDTEEEADNEKKAFAVNQYVT